MMATAIQSDPIHSKTAPALIGKLLAKRQETLVFYNRLAGLKSASEPSALQPFLQQFCQALVDYVALWHFEVYECLQENANDSACCQHIKQVARTLCSQIARTTQAAIDFNDRHDGNQTELETIDSLRTELSQLGEHLATRIDLEDQLIDAIQTPAPSAAASALAQ
jgi:regulator of sigma D